MRELKPEDEERIINRITGEVMKTELQTVAIIFLETIKPVSQIGSQMSMMFVAPFLTGFGGLGIDYIKFFEKRENIEKLVKRLEEEVKIRDEEKRKVKEQGKLISNRFGIKLNLLSGFSLQEDATYNGSSSGLIAITRRDSAVGGSLAISYTATDSAPCEILNEVSTTLDKEDVRRALMLSQDIALDKFPSWLKPGKIKGHKMSMAAYEWKDKHGQRGILEGYGMWCDKTKRFFVMSMRTGPLTRQKNEKNQIQDLRLILSSLKCH
jgi:hypothetical protein